MVDQTKLVPVWDLVLKNDDFLNWPGGLSHHHKGRGCLARHTNQVLQLCIAMGGVAGADLDVLRTAAIWHDFGKTFEYELVSPDVWEWRRNPEFNHILVSANNFGTAATLANLPKEFIADVTHCILSHHGRKDWGAFEEPATIEAQVLHYCDMVSMTMDCGNDVLKR